MSGVKWKLRILNCRSPQWSYEQRPYSAVVSLNTLVARPRIIFSEEGMWRCVDTALLNASSEWLWAINRMTWGALVALWMFWNPSFLSGTCIPFGVCAGDTLSICYVPLVLHSLCVLLSLCATSSLYRILCVMRSLCHILLVLHSLCITLSVRHILLVLEHLWMTFTLYAIVFVGCTCGKRPCVFTRGVDVIITCSFS